MKQVLLGMETAQPFAAAITQKYGNPVWNAVVTGKSGYEINTWLLPLQQLGSIEIIHFIELRKNRLGKYDVVLHRKQDYLRYSTTRKAGVAQTAADRFLYKYFLVNEVVFGYTQFKVPGVRFFANKQRDTSAPIQLKLTRNAGNAKMVYHEICVITTTTIAYCGTPNFPACSDEDGCDRCPSYCSPITTSTTQCEGWWADDGTGTGSGGTGGGSTGGGGGGGTGGTGGTEECDPYAPPTGPAAMGGTNLYVAALSPPPACPPPPGEDGPYPVTPMQIFYNNLDSVQKAFWDNGANLGYVNLLVQKLVAEQYSVDSEEFVSWAINYIKTNLSLTPAAFENQFLGKAEGYDGLSDQAFWDNPNNTFPPMALPSWSAFDAAFPSRSNPLYDTKDKLINAIGGELKTTLQGEAYDNTCAVRLSRALNYSGITIPEVFNAGKGVNVTWKGADGKNYFVNAEDMNRWMRKAFGCQNPNTNIGEYFNNNSFHYTQAQAGTNGENLPDLLGGIKGIYSMIANDPSKETGLGATGHVDRIKLYNTCDGNCLYAPKGGIKYIDVWKLN